MSEWISTHDKLPDINVKVLVKDDAEQEFISYLTPWQEWFYNGHEYPVTVFKFWKVISEE